MTTGSIYADKFYHMDPQFEDIVPGSQLEDGMIVLIEDALIRAHPEHIFSDYDQARLDECNRWCTVTRRQFHGHLITFIGDYGDTQRVRTYDQGYYWISKKGTSIMKLNEPERLLSPFQVMLLVEERKQAAVEEATAAVERLKEAEYQRGFVAGYRAAQAAMKADLKELLT